MPELARDPSEQCIYDDSHGRRCLNRRCPSSCSDHPVRSCEGPHRFTVEEPVERSFAATLGGAAATEIRKQTRTTRQRYAMAWAKAAFGTEQSTSLHQRALRLLEEAVELYQASAAATQGSTGSTWMDTARARAHELVDYVFERPVGAIGQELGGIAVCMLVYAEAADLDVDDMEVKELHRVLNKPIEEFAKRNAAKNAAGFDATAAAKHAVHAPVLTGPPAWETYVGCSCGVRYTTNNPDEHARHVASVSAVAKSPNLRRTTPVTEEEYQLFDAVHFLYTALSVSNPPVGSITKARGDLELAVRAWGDAREPHDIRTPTEIANGVTDLMPTRVRTIKPISSNNARKPLRVMHLRRLPEPTGAKPDECLVCHRLAETFTAADMYTYERDLYKLDARRCDGAWIQPLVVPAPPWAAPEPIPMLLWCPACHVRHIEGELAHKPHHTHACQACGFTWRPAVVPTTGVQFLPGFKDKEA